MKVFVIDDDQIMIEIQTDLLEEAGHTVVSESDSDGALERIRAERPDCVVTDLMMPGIDGYRLLDELRKTPELSATKVVVLSSKSFEYDRQQVLRLGADAFIAKPIDGETYSRTIQDVLEDRMLLTYWGVRGTMPRTGESALRYGGNTSCVTLGFSRDRTFIFDAGTGIKAFADSLMREGRTSLAAKIFVSHPHWDHINALPLFSHMFIAGNEFEVLGAGDVNKDMREIISGQMADVYSPITIKQFGSTVTFRDLVEGEHRVDDIAVHTMLLSHPGRCFGYRVDYNSASLCYVTDNELFPPESPYHDANYVRKLTEFVKGADVLITDTTYSDEEYAAKIGWGHSSVSQVVDLAAGAEVGALHLFHHDPDQDDDAIERKLEAASARLQQAGSSVDCIAPKEGDRYRI